MKRRRRWFYALALFALIWAASGEFGCSAVGIRTSEERPHQVVLRQGKYEVRRYAPALIARTEVQGTYDDTGGKAFNRLGGYIFGNNAEDHDIAMTIPVVQEQPGRRIAMTAPVTQQQDGDRWSMTFVMPAEYTLKTLPKPLDPNVSIEQVPGALVGVFRYSGFMSDADLTAHSPALTDWLETQGYRPTSAPRLAAYDPPWTIPFLRRNEVHFDVEPTPQTKQ